MFTPLEFLTELAVNVVQIFEIFFQQVIMGVDPLTALSWVMGAVLIGFASVVLGYLVLGAVLRELGVQLPTPR